MPEDLHVESALGRTAVGMRLKPDPYGISLRHAVDLLQLTATEVRGLGQYQDLQRLIPVLIERMDELAAILEELGTDSRVLLESDPRLARLAQYVDHWKRQMNLLPPLPREPLVFQIHGAPAVSQLRLLKKTAQQLTKSGRPILVTLAGKELLLEAGAWKLALPARFPRPGARLVRPVFLNVLLDNLEASEWIACTADDDGYSVHQTASAWPAEEETEGLKRATRRRRTAEQNAKPQRSRETRRKSGGSSGGEG